MKWHTAYACLGAAVLLGASGVADAQGSSDSVTLYGRVVAGFDYQNHVYDEATGKSHSVHSGADNQWGTSMFGFKGTEDLGGGVRAIFNLESGFSGTTGNLNGDALFNRRAYVGLQSDEYGTLMMGKNQPIADQLWALDPTGQQFIGSATLVRGRNWQGDNNMFLYESPRVGGVGVQLMTTASGVGSGNRKDALSLSYVDSVYELRAIYDVARDEDGKYSDVFAYSKELTLGGTVTWNDLKLFAGYELLDAPDVKDGQTDRAQHYWLGARYRITPALTLIGAAYRVNANQGGGSANLFMAGVDYSLSPRTLLYASVGNVQNGDNANFSVEATNYNPARGQSQTGFYVGMAHSF